MIFIKKIYKLLCFNIKPKPEPQPQPEEAYCRALESGYTRELEEMACKNPIYAYMFYRNIHGADIGYCQENACKDPEYAYWFALEIKGADIKYCQEYACKDPLHAYVFACDIPEADLNYCLEACKGTIYYAELQVHIMEEALG